MANPIDPRQIVRQLQQVLVTGKLPIGFFIGAGCPVSIRVNENGADSPLIPDVANLTIHVLKDLASRPDVNDATTRLLNILKQDGEPNPNIERILSRARALHDVAGQGEVRGITHLELAAINVAICNSIAQRVARDLPKDTPYHSLARFCGAARSLPVSIFTTNYDLLMEQAFEHLRVPFFDGFIGSNFPFFDQQAVEQDVIPNRWTRFWKLHGSINWKYERARHCVIRKGSDASGEEHMIHPSHLKYDASRRMPYLIMIDRMRTFLRDARGPVAIFVAGYSFGDEHLNEVILEGLQANPNAACYALQYGPLGNYSSAADIARTVLNLTIIAEDGAISRGRDCHWAVRKSDDRSTLGSSFTFDDAADENSDEDAAITCKCKLGNFSSFAQLLDELTIASDEKAG